MKGKLLVPLRSTKEHAELIDVITSAFRANGHSINTDVMNVKESEVISYREHDLVSLHQKLQKEIKISDFLVAEISEPSSGIGYLIAQAIVEKKPVLALVKEGSLKKAPLPFKAGASKLIHLMAYSNISDITPLVGGFLEKIKDQIDTKFILIISPEIDKYLEWAGAERRMHKAQVVREAIETMMNKDKDYKEFLKSID